MRLLIHKLKLNSSEFFVCFSVFAYLTFILFIGGRSNAYVVLRLQLHHFERKIGHLLPDLTEPMSQWHDGTFPPLIGWFEPEIGESTVIGARMPYRKWRENKQDLI